MRERVTRRNVCLVITGLVILITPFALGVIFGTGAVSAASAGISGVLSLSLIVLYYQQSQIQQRQIQLLERDFESDVSVQPPVFAEEDEVRFGVRNNGRGAVKRMYLSSELVGDIGDLKLEPGWTHLKTVDSEEVFLESFSKMRKFKATVKLANPEDDGARPFKWASLKILQSNVDSVTLKLTLEIIDEETRKEEHIKEIEIAEREILRENLDGLTTLEDSLAVEGSLSAQVSQGIFPHDHPFINEVSVWGTEEVTE